MAARVGTRSAFICPVSDQCCVHEASILRVGTHMSNHRNAKAELCYGAVCCSTTQPIAVAHECYNTPVLRWR